MAISVGGTVVIDDGRNIVNVNDMRVGLVTFYGSTGDIETPGEITASSLNVPISVVSFSPALGSDDNLVSGLDISITFDQVVGVATTGYVNLHAGSPDGTLTDSIPVSDLTQTEGPFTVTIPNVVGTGGTSIYPVIMPDIISYSSGTSFPGINTDAGDTYYYNTAPGLGEEQQGGYLICQASSVQWIVALSSTEVSRCWYCRNDANTRAQQVSGCTGWFIPTCSQLQNPGYVCRTNWDSYCNNRYWSSTPFNSSGVAWSICVWNNGGCCVNSNGIQCVRSFRCVTY